MIFMIERCRENNAHPYTCFLGLLLYPALETVEQYKRLGFFHNIVHNQLKNITINRRLWD